MANKFLTAKASYSEAAALPTYAAAKELLLPPTTVDVISTVVFIFFVHGVDPKWREVCPCH